ncbi:MAG TPA: diguanylate cyclase, partial [Actinomycetales bacterium]
MRAPAQRASVRRRSVVPDEVLHTLTDGLLVLTPTGRVVQANDSVFSMLSATPGLRHAFAATAYGEADDLVGADARSLLVDAGALSATGRPLRADMDPIRACLATGLTTTTRIGLPQSDGSVQWVSARVRPVRTHRTAAAVDPARDLVDAVIVVLTESTTDEAVLVALRDRDHQLSVAQRMAHLSMWRWDTATGAVTWIDGDDRDTGTTGQQRSMTEYLDGIHPDDRPLHDRLMADLLRGVPSGELDLRYRTSGGWLHWHLWAESVVDADGVVTALWGTTQEVTERREAEAAVRRLSMTDSLTELANRAQVLERLGAALVAREPGVEVGLVLLDVDRFRHVNDRYGPSAGDLLLIQIGRRLRRLTSGEVTAGRLGSDQFALVLDRASASDAAELARIAFVALSTPFELAGVSEPVHVTVSVGTAVSTHDAPPSAGELFRQGEIAMSYAHSAGGSRVVFFDDALRAQVGGRLDMDGRLRAALISGDLFPVFQPVFTLGSDRHRDRVTSCEALARMTGPGGLIPPSDFIPVAEESGLIIELDLAVIDQAVAQILLHPPL